MSYCVKFGCSTFYNVDIHSGSLDIWTDRHLKVSWIMYLQCGSKGVTYSYDNWHMQNNCNNSVTIEFRNERWMMTIGYCFRSLLEVRMGPQKAFTGDCWSNMFLGCIPFLSSSQQCLSTEGVRNELQKKLELNLQASVKFVDTLPCKNLAFNSAWEL